MNNISLKQVTAFVIAICLASFFVNADETITHTTEENTEIFTEISDNSVVMPEVKESSDGFTFTSLDTNKNGKLSEKEVLAGKNDWLVKAFNQIDYNADESITEQELVDFATNMATSITTTD